MAKDLFEGTNKGNLAIFGYMTNELLRHSGEAGLVERLEKATGMDKTFIRKQIAQAQKEYFEKLLRKD
jgi:hypothetical protein